MVDPFGSVFHRPVGVAYTITLRGRTALGFLDALRTWAESTLDEDDVEALG